MEGISLTSCMSRMAAQRIATGILAVGLAITASSGTAYAGPGSTESTPVLNFGSNGQQVRACDDSTLYQAVKISGTSHTGTQASTSACLDIENCHSFWNWWWVGRVTLKWYRDGSSQTVTTHCNVPKVDPDWNWVFCPR